MRIKSTILNVFLSLKLFGNTNKKYIGNYTYMYMEMNAGL
jgi:hypothetical protein